MSVYDQKLIPPEANNYCVPPHWDATMIFRATIPQGPSVPLPMDPRPYTKICLQYRTTGEFKMAPAPPKNMVFPWGGEHYPPTRYIQNIDSESALERLDRPLDRDPIPWECPGVPYYLPNPKGDMYDQRMLVPPPKPAFNDIMVGLAHPNVTRNVKAYDCYTKETKCDIEANPKIWFNATKMQKYNQREEPCGERFGYIDGKLASAENLPRVYAKN